MKGKMALGKATTLSLASALALLWSANLGLALGQQTAPHRSIALEIAVGQDGPISIMSVTSTHEYIFERVIVKNMSDQHVSSVTFGVLLHPTAQPKVRPELVSARSVPTTIGPGQERMIEVYDFKPSAFVERIDRVKSPSARAELGVLAVEFEDGVPWNFDPVSRGGFVSAQSSRNRLTWITASKGLAGAGDYLPKVFSSLSPGRKCSRAPAGNF